VCRDFHSPVNRAGSNDSVTDVRQSTVPAPANQAQLTALNPTDACFSTSVASCELNHRPNWVTFEATGRSPEPSSLLIKEGVLPHFRGFEDAGLCAEGGF
jgi:hypothetical protein